jgi:hypothetical protein
MSEEDKLLTLVQLREKLAKLMADDSDANKEAIADLEKQIRLRTQSVEAIEDSIRAQEKYIAGLSEVGKNLDSNILKREAAAELTRRLIELAEKKLQLGGEEAKQGAQEITELKKKLDAQNAMLDASKEFNKSLDMSTGLSRKVTQGILMAKVATEDMGAAMKSVMATSMRLADSAASSFIDKQISSINELLVSYDKQSKAFEKQYALGEASQDQIKSLYQEMNQYGASVEDVTKAYGELATGFTDFTMIAGTQQKAIAETATTLERAYGIANGDFASGMQNATKMMGMTAGQAEGYQRELAATAEALGVPPAQLAAQFASMGPQFSKFGNQAGKAFKDLARISKITGMELEKVLAITNKFDTFEGAAEQAGQLNAALGGNFVNAMDLMMATDPAERFGMIRDAITSTGLSFDDMSYYQKQFYTNSLGLSDVGDLALMMSGNMDMMSGSSNESAAALIEQKQRAQDLMTVQERINAMFAENSELMIDYLEDIETAAKFLQEHGRAILGVAIGLKALSFGLGVYNGIQTILAARTVVSTESLIAQTAAQEALNSAQKRGTKITAGAGKAAGTAALNMLAFGAAVALIGGGIYLAATGIGNMAESFKGLSDEVLFTTRVITAGMAAVVIALAALAPALATASTGLIPFGLGVALVGAGVGLAAAGIGLMAEGMGGIVESLVEFANAGGGIYEFAMGVGALALSFYTLAGSLAALGNPLSILGVSTLSAVGNIMANKMEGVFTAMGNITKAKMLSIQTGFAEIAGSINEVSSLKVAPLAMAMTAVAAAPAAAAAAAAPAASANTNSNAGKVAQLTVQFVLDGDRINQKVVSIVKDEIGGFSIGAVRNSS